MKKTLIFILLLLWSANNSFASPLIFKSSKQINSSNFVELGIFDAVKYKSIRILVSNSNYLNRRVKVDFEIRLDSAKRNLERLEAAQRQGVVSQNQVDEAKQNLTELQKESDKSNDIEAKVAVYAIEGEDEILLDEYSNNLINKSFVIDNPPSKIKISVKGQGKFNLHIWGQ